MKREKEDPYPPHSLVDWDVTEVRAEGPKANRRNRLYVKVECPECHTKRFAPAARVRREIRWGMFTGRCATHRMPWPDKHLRRAMPPINPDTILPEAHEIDELSTIN